MLVQRVGRLVLVSLFYNYSLLSVMLIIEAVVEDSSNDSTVSQQKCF
jgi:hypothetical protein